jgi:hypothetical protein
MDENFRIVWNLFICEKEMSFSPANRCGSAPTREYLPRLTLFPRKSMF